ncbi:hypothetical protein RSAG8_06108, partial [Rhizoctonia solani AG-8 WAC10335]
MLNERRPPTANSRISAFLESQRGLMSYYAAEGKTVAATWPKQSSGDSFPASPMLVPRAAAAKGDGLPTMVHSVSPDEPVPTFPIDKKESSMPESQKPRPANSSKSTRVVPVQLGTQRKSIDRDQCSDDEPERLHSLFIDMGITDAAKSYCWSIQQGQELWQNNEERTGGEVDIVFSESRFLGKTPSARDGDEDIEDDSDSSDDRSAHSLAERARRQKDGAINSSQRSSNKVVLDQTSRSGSPVPSSRSIREESPPWNIEETIPSSPSSTKAPDNGHSTSSTQKDITVSTERSVWASKLRNPGPHTPAIPDNTNSTSGSHLPRAPPTQARTISAYFAPIAMLEEPQLSVAPSIELDRLENKQPDHRVDSCSIAAPDSADPPSTPECLQLEHARLLSAPGNTYMRALEECLPLNEAPATRPLSPATDPQDDDIQSEWDYGVEPQPDRGVQGHFTLGHTKRPSCANEYIWNDSDIPGWEQYPHSRNAFPVEEAQFHEAHPNVDYDVPFEDRVKCSNEEPEYLYEDSECFYEDGEYLDRNGSYTLHQGDGDLEYDDYNLHMEVVQEQEPDQPIEWSPIGDTTLEDFDPDQADPELDNMMVQDESMETEDEWIEQTPCFRPGTR